MKIIDCECIESAYRSLESITEIDEAQLNSIFDQYELADLHFENDSDPLFTHIRKQSKEISVDEVCGFHITRVPASTTFEDGLLPSHLVLKMFWKILYSLVEKDIPGDEFEKFKKLFSLSDDALKQHPQDSDIGLVRDKMQNPVLAGPDGMVIREIAFYPEKVGNRDFFKTPEFVGDICKVFDREYKLDLTERYRNYFRRCIVKYKSQLNPDTYFNCLITYAYYKYKGFEFDRNLQCTLNNHGKTIGPEDILNIEWIDN
ncbi:MAG: hypothetical protein M3367_10725 [Acidobacteriota bacterium]|nr:hypothetical protein [Acidobacteriota bacterium]